MSDPEGVLLPHGGYEHLRSYKVAEAVYDATVVFCDRFIEKRSRTHDQMVQAARSGARNISEGSGAAATSRKSEMKLTNVARASLNDELLKDYKSFLLQRGLRVWHKDSPEALAMRERLKHDKAPGLPAAPPGKVRLTGLAGLSDFVGKAEPELAAERHALRGEPSRLPAETPTGKPEPGVFGKRRVHGELVRRTDEEEGVRQARLVGRSRVPGLRQAHAPPNRKKGPARRAGFWGLPGVS